MPDSCDPVDSSLPGSSVHGILQARILEWVAISFSRLVCCTVNWFQKWCCFPEGTRKVFQIDFLKIICLSFLVLLDLCCYAWAFSRRSGFPCGGAQALECEGFRSWGAQVSLPWGTWDLPRPGIEPVFPCIGRRILNHRTTREVLDRGLSSQQLSEPVGGSHVFTSAAPRLWGMGVGWGSHLSSGCSLRMPGCCMCVSHRINFILATALWSKCEITLISEMMKPGPRLVK